MRGGLLVVALAILALAGCSLTAGGGTSSGGQSGGRAATIDLTFSGNLSGRATQLDRTKPNDCSSDPKDSVQFHLYGFQLFPIVNGGRNRRTL